MKNGDFTKPKFLAFPLERQHKKCAEILRISYEKSISQKSFDDEMEAYSILAKWMDYPELSIHSHKDISDRYHEHATQALLKHKEHNLLPKVRQGDRQSAETPWEIAVYLDNIRSAHNVGSILRTVEAFSLGSVHFSKNTPFTSNKQVQDTTMGAEKWIECSSNANLQDLPRPLIVMETSDSAIPLYDFIFPEIFTLVVGNEEYGCSEATLQNADVILEIPLRGHKNSLNVANAFAVAAGEIARQKGLQPHLKGDTSHVR
ncbi:MAG TPA: TrmH family RNA methyltransferase [Parachlamydiaceae bacterium]|nr:TrmH family RNA methyltransferase [Parachlamydiaceae bacterium]